MNFVHRNRLSVTLDLVSEALFFHRRIPAAQRRAVARWIASRQGLPGAYADMFAPTAKDTLGLRLLTGEVVRTQVGIAHILGEECCRVLRLLGVNDLLVEAALGRAVRGMVARLEEAQRRGYSLGMYCCGTCSVAYWRNLAIGVLPRAEERLRLGLKGLKDLRRGDGQWRRFPFFYTCLALTEIGPDLARDEMQYAAGRWQRVIKRLGVSRDSMDRRRAAVGQRLLELCEG